MVRAYHIDFQTKFGHLFQKLEYQRRIQQENVCKILLSMGHYRIADLIIKLFIPGIMLAKGIAGEENLVLFHIGKHAVRPVEHPGFQKHQCSFTQTQLFSIFDSMIIPLLWEVLGKVLQPHF